MIKMRAENLQERQILVILGAPYLAMQRIIIIIGNSGTGKSTLARALGTSLGLPVVHLDRHYWRAGWQATPREEWHERVRSLVRPDRWILDGNYSSSLDIRIARADTVILLDFPTLRACWGAFRRVVSNYGHSRADCADHCPERLDIEFFHYILTYNMRRRPMILAKLRMINPPKQVHILRNRQAVHAFLNRIKAEDQ